MRSWSSWLCSLLLLGTAVSALRPAAYVVELSTKPHDSMFYKRDNSMIVRYTYDSALLRGMAVEFASEDVAKQALQHQDVINYWPITPRSRPAAATNHTATNDLPLKLAHKDDVATLTAQNNVYKQLGVTGKSIRIGIIDSGVDYRHPALGGCFGPKCKVAFGHDLVGNNYDGTPNSIQESDDPLDDCPANSTAATGHGTFVSGLIAAQDKIYNWTGVAPEAKLGMWRVFGCNTGRTGNDILIKAMEMAFHANMDIISISLGDAGGWEEDVLSVIANRMVAQGRHVVVASGNSGGSGIFLTATPATGRDVIAVGSTLNDHTSAYMLSIDDTLDVPYRSFVSLAIDLNGTLPMVASSHKFNVTDDGCKPLGDDAKNAIVLIHKGGCSTSSKVQHAEQAGAKAVVIYTDTHHTTDVEVISGAKVPVAFINSVDGEKVHSILVKSKHAKATFTHIMTAVPAPPHDVNRISSTSTLGPTNEMQLKPELVAVGGNVFSTLPHYKNYYGVMSGTSFSGPFVAGCVALLLEKHHLSPDEMKTVLMNYASPVRPLFNSLPYGDSPVRQGAGLVDVVQAVEGMKHFSVTPAKISFNDTMHHKSQTLTIHNTGDHEFEVTLSHVPSLTVTGYNQKHPEDFTPTEPIAFAVHNNSVASLSFSKTHVTIPKGGSVSVEIDAHPPKDIDPKSHPIYGGYIRLTSSASKDKKITAHVPYIGMSGNMSSLPILDRTKGDPSKPGHYPFPAIGFGNGTILANDTGYFNISSDLRDQPVVLARLLTGTAQLRMTVLQDGKAVGEVPNDPLSDYSREWMQRNTLAPTSSSVAYYAWPWNGVYTTSLNSHDKKAVQPGHVYQIRLEALYVFGDRDKKEDWDIWTSPKMIFNVPHRRSRHHHRASRQQHSD